MTHAPELGWERDERERPLSSFTRGLQVLATVAERGPVRVEQLAEQLAIPPSTLYRYVRALKDGGFVEERDGAYEAGIWFLQFAGRNIGDHFLLERSGPLLRAIARYTGETAIMTVRSGAAALCLNSVESPLKVRLSFQRGAVAPLYAGASAKILLAFSPPTVLEEVLAAGLRPLTPNTPDEPRLRLQLAEIRARGYATTDSEIDPGASAVAVPVLWADTIVCALSVAGPSFRFTPARQQQVLRVLQGAARRLKDALGSPVGAPNRG